MRQIIKSNNLALTVLICLSQTAQAQGTDDTTPEVQNSNDPDEKREAHVDEARWSDFLPIWGADARAQGYTLPRPFGVSLAYIGQKQPFGVDGVEIAGIDIKESGLAVIEEVDNQEDTHVLRFDVWLFPFLNVYGILGKTDGRVEGPLSVDPSVILGEACGLPNVDCSTINTQFSLDYKGDVAGGGLAIAGGYKNFFAMIDSSYAVTDLDISSVDAKATVTSARFGWNGTLGGFTGALWLGAMYQDINQTLDLEFAVPEGLAPLLGASVVDVSVEQSTESPYNTVLGGRWEISRNFEMLAELGIGDRRSNMLGISYRF